MKRIFIILFALLSLLAQPAVSQISPVTLGTGVVGATGGSPLTLNTVGANFIVIGLWYFVPAAANISDNLGNTWIMLSAQVNGNMGTVLYYCSPCTVGSSQTFSTTSHFAGVGVGAFSGVATSSPFDLQNGFAQNASGNIQPGAITPSVNNELIITAMGSFNGTAAPSMPTGYSSIGANTTSTAQAGGMGFKIQTTATSENPTWTSNGSSECAVIASFKPPFVAPPTVGNFFLIME